MVPNSTAGTQNAGTSFVVLRVSPRHATAASVAVLVDGVLETNPTEFNCSL
jgi:hypothetical protein